MTVNDSSFPEISVVIPVYNGTNYLHESIESVLGQSYRNFEIVVVDDGSKDETWSMIEKYMAEYPGQVRGVHKENGGIASALNAGIMEAKGKYFAWLSHDDRFVPDKLEKQMKLLQEKPELVGVYSDYSHIDAQGQKIRYFRSAWYPSIEKMRYLLWSCYINGSTILVERRCLIEAGLFDSRFPYAQDWMMWVHLVMNYELGYIPEPLTDYRIHEVQTTQSTRQKLLKREETAFRRSALATYSIQQIFPELDRPDVTERDIALAYCDLGRLFTTMVREVNLGYEQFWKSWQTWPNLRNPVLVKAGGVTKMLVLRKLRHLLAPVRAKASRWFPQMHRPRVVNPFADVDSQVMFRKFAFATANKGVSKR